MLNVQKCEINRWGLLFKKLILGWCRVLFLVFLYILMEIKFIFYKLEGVFSIFKDTYLSVYFAYKHVLFPGESLNSKEELQPIYEIA